MEHGILGGFCFKVDVRRHKQLCSFATYPHFQLILKTCLHCLGRSSLSSLSCLLSFFHIPHVMRDIRLTSPLYLSHSSTPFLDNRATGRLAVAAVSNLFVGKNLLQSRAWIRPASSRRCCCCCCFYFSGKPGMCFCAALMAGEL